MLGKAFRHSMLSLAAIAIVVPTGGMADTPDDLRDMVGMRGSSSDNAMMQRGYTLAKSTDYAGYWWNNSRKNCVSVMVNNGRVANVNSEGSKQCGKGGDGGAVAAVAIGALLIAALAAGASKKHNSDNDDYDHGSNYSYSPARGITCYPRQSSCYDEGSFSSYWTRREF